MTIPHPIDLKNETLPETDRGKNPSKPPFLRRVSNQLSCFWAVLTLVAFLAGSLSGFMASERRHASGAEVQAAHESGAAQAAHLARQVNPPEGYTLPATYGNIGPKLIAAGAFDLETFVSVYEQAGQPLDETQLAILQQGSREAITINRQNAYFLLNLLWAFGLTNKNSILTEGPIVAQSGGKVENFASTGGWSIAAKPIPDLIASAEIVTLTAAQQELVQKVGEKIYRPCCNNPTHFPDCNHGMAMLGLLELMASQGADEKDMFEAAKYVNAFWYPSQNMELATFFQAAMQQEYATVSPELVVSGNYSSGSGFQQVHAWLAQNGLLEQAPGGSGGGCGV